MISILLATYVVHYIDMFNSISLLINCDGGTISGYHRNFLIIDSNYPCPSLENLNVFQVSCFVIGGFLLIFPFLFIASKYKWCFTVDLKEGGYGYWALFIWVTRILFIVMNVIFSSAT